MASGECDYQYHGANRLGANSLLSATYSGTISGPEALRLARSGKLGDALTSEELEAARKECVEEFDKIRNMNGAENAHQMHHELGDIMYKYVSIERDNNGLKQCMKELHALLKRWDNIGVTDHGNWANQEAMFVRQLRNMIIYAMAITKSALQRDESRGAHAKIVLKSDYDSWDAAKKQAFDEKNGKYHFDAETGRAMTDDGNDDLLFFGRDDEKFMRTTVVSFDAANSEPEVSYREFEHSLIKPRLRNYAVAKKE
jgi:succinate dehydrogenase / fumarate reductase flavoprotein subunit